MVSKWDVVMLGGLVIGGIILWNVFRREIESFFGGITQYITIGGETGFVAQPRYKLPTSYNLPYEPAPSVLPLLSPETGRFETEEEALEVYKRIVSGY